MAILKYIIPLLLFYQYNCLFLAINCDNSQSHKTKIIASRISNQQKSDIFEDNKFESIKSLQDINNNKNKISEQDEESTILFHQINKRSIGGRRLANRIQLAPRPKSTTTTTTTTTTTENSVIEDESSNNNNNNEKKKQKETTLKEPEYDADEGPETEENEQKQVEKTSSKQELVINKEQQNNDRPKSKAKQANIKNRNQYQEEEEVEENEEEEVEEKKGKKKETTTPSPPTKGSNKSNVKR